MSGSEELARHSRSFRDDMYLPDDTGLQNILASMARARAERLQHVGDLRGAGTMAPLQALESGMEHYRQAKSDRQGSEEHAMRMREAEQRMGGNATQQELQRLKLSEEQKNQAFMDQDTGGGQSRRQALGESEYHRKLDEPVLARQEHQQKIKEMDLAMSQIRQQMGQAGIVANNTQEDREQAKLAAAIGGIAVDPNKTPEQQDKEISELVHGSHLYSSIGTKSGTTPDTLTNMAKGWAATTRANVMAGRAAAETITESQQPYQAMKGATEGATKAVGTLTELKNLRDQYENGLRLGAVGEMAGAAGGEDASAEAARKNFAQLADQIQPGQGQIVGGTHAESALSRMDEVLNTLGGHVKSQWEQTGDPSIHPSMRNRPEYTQTLAKINALPSGAGQQPPRNQVSSGPLASPLANSNRGFVTGPQPPPSGTAQAAPAPSGMPPQPQMAPPGMPGQAPGQPQQLPWQFPRQYPPVPATGAGQ